MEVSQLLGNTYPAPALSPGEEGVPAVFLSVPKVDSPVPLKLEPPEPSPTPHKYVMNKYTVVHGVELQAGAGGEAGGPARPHYEPGGEAAEVLREPGETVQVGTDLQSIALLLSLQIL